MDEPLDEAALERLEGEIEREEQAVADLDRRTRTLEVEAAAWPRPPGIRGPHQVAADRSRALGEAFLGLMGGWLLVVLVGVIGALWAKGLP